MKASDQMSTLCRPGLTIGLIAMVALTTGLQFASCTAMRRWQHWLGAVNKNERHQIGAFAKGDSDRSLAEVYRMNREIEAKIAAMDFVQATFVALEMKFVDKCISRCRFLIGGKLESDFSIRPWLEGDSNAPLGPRDVWAQAYSGLKMGDPVSLAGEMFHVTGLIDQGNAPYSDGGCYLRLDTLDDLAQRSDGEWQKKCSVIPMEPQVWVMIKLKPSEEGGLAGDEALKVLKSAYPAIFFHLDSKTPARNEWTPHLFALVIAVRVFALLLWPGMLPCLVAGFTRLRRANPSEGVAMKIFRSAYIALIGSGLGFIVFGILIDLIRMKKAFVGYALPSPWETHFIQAGSLIAILALILALASIPISDRLSRRSEGGGVAEG
jgi:hypothetical protein